MIIMMKIWMNLSIWMHELSIELINFKPEQVFD